MILQQDLLVHGLHQLALSFSNLFSVRNLYLITERIDRNDGIQLDKVGGFFTEATSMLFLIFLLVFLIDSLKSLLVLYPFPWLHFA